MKRALAVCLLLPLSGALLAAPPVSTPAPTETDAATQQRMAALQARMNALASRMAALSAKIGDEANASTLRYFADSRRGMLGMAVHSTDDSFHVDAVTPGGPAERAGLKAGDTITAVNGKALSRNNASTLTGLSDLPAGKPARLAVSRDGKTLHVDVTPERLQPEDWRATVRAAERAADQAVASVQSPEFQKHIQQSIDEAMKNASAAIDSAAIARESASAAREAAIEAGENSRHWFVSMSPWWGLNLAPLNPDLGGYFGTDKGVLVLSRSDKQFPELQPGDVITDIGGKSMAQPEDVQRALRGAGDDKNVRIAVRRHGKALNFAMKVPPRWNLLPPQPPPAPPVPPMPPTPPAPSAPVAPPTPPTPPAPPPPVSAIPIAS